jgi:hypothetical protein
MRTAVNVFKRNLSMLVQYFKNVLQPEVAFPGTDVRIFGEKWAFFAQTAASFCKHLIITLVYEKKRKFFHRKLAKAQKHCMYRGGAQTIHFL